MAFRDLIDGLHDRLVERGWHDVRGSYGYVFLAVRDEAHTTTEIGSLVGMTKQAASKLIDAMEASGYVRRHADAHDARAKLVSATARGRRLLEAVEAIYATWRRSGRSCSASPVSTASDSSSSVSFGPAMTVSSPPVRPAR
jgi:DNA-binding MarR family transcriptional regulator